MYVGDVLHNIVPTLEARHEYLDNGRSMQFLCVYLYNINSVLAALASLLTRHGSNVTCIVAIVLLQDS